MTTLAERIIAARKRDFTHHTYNNGWDAILADVRELERNDARYRWLRSQPNDTTAPRIDVVYWEPDDESANAGTGFRMAELDAAIDAAISHAQAQAQGVPGE